MGNEIIHDDRGKFKLGNPGGPGNPHMRRVHEIRNKLMSCVTDEDLEEIAAALIAKAKAGDVIAAREILDRIMGKPTQHVEGKYEWTDANPPTRDEAMAEFERMLRAIGPDRMRGMLARGN